MISINLINGAQPLPSLQGNCEEGAIGERSDGGAKPGQGWGQYYTNPLTQGHLSPLRLGVMTALNVLSNLRFFKPLGRY